MNNTNSTVKVRNDVPETPPEVANRQRNRVALTQHAADSDKLNTIALPDSESGPTRASVSQDQHSREEIARMDAQVEALNEISRSPVGHEPTRGLTAAQHHEILARKYEGSPEMSLTFGDLTPEFIVWLYENHPMDAHVRYYARLMPSLGVWMERTHPDFVYESRNGSAAAQSTERNNYIIAETNKQVALDLAKAGVIDTSVSPALRALRAKHHNLLLQKQEQELRKHEEAETSRLLREIDEMEGKPSMAEMAKRFLPDPPETSDVPAPSQVPVTPPNAPKKRNRKPVSPASKSTQ